MATDASNRFLVLLVALILASGVFAWVSNYVRQAFSAKVVGDVVLTLRKDAFGAVLKRDMSFYDENPVGQDRQPGHLRHRRLRHHRHPDDEPAQPGAAGRVHHGAAVRPRRRPRPAHAGDRADRGRPGAWLPPDRPRHHTPGAAVARPGQRQRPGDDERDRGRQELPPGAARSTTSSGRSTQQSYQRDPAAGLRLQRDLPAAVPGRRSRHRRCSSTSAARSVLGGRRVSRRLVSVPAGGRAVLVPADEHRVVLEPVPAGPLRGRAGLRADRRDTAGWSRHDPKPVGPPDRPDRVPGRRLRLQRDDHRCCGDFS